MRVADSRAPSACQSSQRLDLPKVEGVGRGGGCRGRPGKRQARNNSLALPSPILLGMNNAIHRRCPIKTHKQQTKKQTKPQ